MWYEIWCAQLWFCDCDIQQFTNTRSLVGSNVFSLFLKIKFSKNHDITEYVFISLCSTELCPLFILSVNPFEIFPPSSEVTRQKTPRSFLDFLLDRAASSFSFQLLIYMRNISECTMIFTRSWHHFCNFPSEAKTFRILTRMQFREKMQQCKIKELWRDHNL